MTTTNPRLAAVTLLLTPAVCLAWGADGHELEPTSEGHELEPTCAGHDGISSKEEMLALGACPRQNRTADLPSVEFCVANV